MGIIGAEEQPLVERAVAEMATYHYDLAVIGGGPAGAAASLYGSRAGVSVVCFEPNVPAGQIAQTDLVDNYPGLPDVSGQELSETLFNHALSAGADHISEGVESIKVDDQGDFSLAYPSGHLSARSLVCALGATPKRAGFKGEQEFSGRGVSYCATCDAMFFRGKTVYVVGGGKTACEEALFLARFAREVIMLVRKSNFRAPRGIADRIDKVPNITVKFFTSIIEVRGKRMIEEIVLRDNDTQELHSFSYEPGTCGVFVFVGFDPATQLVSSMVEIADDGGVITAEDMSTSTPGLYCAGDMRSKYLRQVVTAVSDGAIAATAAERYVESRLG